ncbi:MAG: 30S ribosomal protein S16 [Bdellovibrionota bacterium]|nr:30S ribosomal protein S16 [Deltaproteobacteria bacterium]
MVTIRLTRKGMKKAPMYRVVVADSRARRDGRFIENVGVYNPKDPKAIGTLKKDRIDYWISKGAKPSDAVRTLINRVAKAS